MPSIAQLAGRTHRALARERRALAASSEDILRTQRAIAGIPAPTFSESARASWMGDRLRECGWNVRADEAGNVIASVGRSTDAIAVCAHLDTVYAPDAPVRTLVKGGRVYGAGVCDNGRGLAALIAIAQVLRSRVDDLEHPVHLVATTAEEGAGDLRGAKHYVHRERPAAFIALDGAGDTRIVNEALGSRRFRIEFLGPGGHSWSAFGVVNPIHAAARCASAIAGLPLAPNTSLTVSRIGGGLAVNAIAEDAWLEVDVRGGNEGVLEGLEREIRTASEAAARDETARRTGGPALRVDVQRIGHRGCGVTDEGSELVTAAIEATRLVARRPELGVASTDANAAVAAGIPAIAIGAGGRGGDVHSSQEWFDNTDGAVGVERALTLVATMARLRV